MFARKAVSVGLVGGLLALVGLCVVSSQAFATSPWWHVNVGVEPTRIQPGAGGDEQLELTVEGTSGQHFELEEPTSEEFKGWEVGALPEEVEIGLDEIYGPGNVEVGPGVSGSNSYLITFIKAFAYRRVKIVVGPTEYVGVTKETLIEKHRGEPDGQVVLNVSNLGNANASGATTPITVVDRLPKGLEAVGVYGGPNDDQLNGNHEMPCAVETATTVTCTDTGMIAPYEEIRVKVLVAVKTGAVSGEVDEATVSGGGAQSVSGSDAVAVGGAPVGFGVEDYEMTPENEGGAPDTQAGSHPYQLTTTLSLNESQDETVPAMAKDLNFNLPPGLLGNPTVIPQCTDPQFFTLIARIGDYCPASTQVGVAAVSVFLPPFIEPKTTFFVPLYNLKPNVGEPARFGFEVYGVPVILDTSIRTGKDYGVTVSVSNVSQGAIFFGSRVTFWGVPEDPSHNSSRGWGCIDNEFLSGTLNVRCTGFEAQHPPALLTMPTACNGPMQTSMDADSWMQEGVFSTVPSSTPMAALDGCNRLQFSPSIKVTPDGQAGSTPTGLTVDEHVPQELSATGTGLSEANVKSLSVTLPEGVALNPAAADGLTACSEQQIGLKNSEPAGCPESSKIATVKIKTPLLPNPLEGAAYLATQDSNPFGSLVAMYVYAEDPVSGVRAKAAGKWSRIR